MQQLRISKVYRQGLGSEFVESGLRVTVFGTWQYSNGDNHIKGVTNLVNLKLIVKDRETKKD